MNWSSYCPNCVVSLRTKIPFSGHDACSFSTDCKMIFFFCTQLIVNAHNVKMSCFYQFNLVNLFGNLISKRKILTNINDWFQFEWPFWTLRHLLLRMLRLSQTSSNRIRDSVIQLWFVYSDFNKPKPCVLFCDSVIFLSLPLSFSLSLFIYIHKILHLLSE